MLRRHLLDLGMVCLCSNGLLHFQITRLARNSEEYEPISKGVRTALIDN